MLFRKREKTPERRYSAEQVSFEVSACTGEKLIGFKNPLTGELEEAVLVRGPQDVDAFYLLHGLVKMAKKEKAGQ